MTVRARLQALWASVRRAYAYVGPRGFWLTVVALTVAVAFGVTVLVLMFTSGGWW